MKLIAFVSSLTAFCAAFSLQPAEAKIASVSIFAFPINYSGQCPATITFQATVIGDPGTVFGYQFVGDGASSTKSLYGYVEKSGDLTVTSTLEVDAAHAGSYYRQVKVTSYLRGIGSPVAGEVLVSDKQPYTVVCVSTTPGPKPSS
jgi:hypothetical protein